MHDLNSFMSVVCLVIKWYIFASSVSECWLRVEQFSQLACCFWPFWDEQTGGRRELKELLILMITISYFLLKFSSSGLLCSSDQFLWTLMHQWKSHLELFSSYYPKFLFFYTLLPQSCHFDLLFHSPGAQGASCCTPTHRHTSQENYLYCPGLGPV